METFCTSHNSHTHTSNTRQSKPQLKECLYSSAVPSHNSRDVIRSHNSRNVTCLPSIPSHNSRDTILTHNSRNAPAKSTLKCHPKLHRSCTSSKTSHQSCKTLNLNMHMNYYSKHPIQLLDSGPRIYHSSTNLPARGPTSMNLPARSPTLRTSPP